MHAIFATSTRGSTCPPPTLRLLGDFAVDPALLAPHGRKARALLARLALADGPLSRDRLSALLWSHRAEPQAHASLRQCLMELKAWTRASPPLLHADREAIAIDHAHVADDVSLLLSACARDDADAVLRWLPADEAPLLADLDGVDEAFDDWLAAERARNTELVVREVLAMAERLLAAGEVDRSLRVADRMTRFDPCSEHAARLVMQARWQSGDDDGVRHAWHRLEDAVARGLDGRPSPETARLYHRLMAETSRLPGRGAAWSLVARPPDRRVRRVAAVVAAMIAFGLTSADAPRKGGGASGAMTPTVRIDPVVSRNHGTIERGFADALAGDFVRLANASGGLVRILDGQARGGGDFIVRVAINRDADALTSESRVVDARSGAILWSNQLSGSPRDLTRLRERTAVSVAAVIDCALRLNDGRAALAADADRRAQVFAICDAHDDQDGARAVALLERFAARWPGDGVALGQLALARAKRIFGEAETADQETHRQLAIRAARRALATDPANVYAMVALSQSGRRERYMVDGLPMLKRALAVDPRFSTALMLQATGLFQAGYVAASVRPSIDAANADPTSIFKALAVVRRLAAAGRLAEAWDRLDAIAAIWPDHPDLVEHRYRLMLEQPDPVRAAALVAATDPDEQWQFDRFILTHIATGSHDSAALDAAAEIEYSRFPAVAYQLAAHYTRLGDIRRALIWLDRAPVRQTSGQWSLLYWPSVAPLRREPRFFAKMARLGLVDYWRRENRWPDFCREPGLRYDCRREAARLVDAARSINAGSAASR
ncbi:BTAD domain-containing putative transcriptional regulator [Sphingopyxis sp. FD7]|uniref:BTAD domain-containing putative transcriptional regulator n=1 Tax=Sphingopyxis sp. FD7 TaxID=1914525 RepID=UPI000DC630DA|nr:BTAD domain-containing putative transcriptional regulator [Sphingopyxis sp. FD7]BBB14181.1 SARP family transcriptional regulator [Sphingopyxis sp. FD7]